MPRPSRAEDGLLWFLILISLTIIEVTYNNFFTTKFERKFALVHDAVYFCLKRVSVRGERLAVEEWDECPATAQVDLEVYRLTDESQDKGYPSRLPLTLRDSGDPFLCSRTSYLTFFMTSFGLPFDSWGRTRV